MLFSAASDMRAHNVTFAPGLLPGANGAALCAQLAPPERAVAALPHPQALASLAYDLKTLTAWVAQQNATKCFTGHGSVLTMQLSGGRIAVRRSGVDSPASARPTHLGAPDGAIRVPIGPTDASALIGDLTQAME